MPQKIQAQGRETCRFIPGTNQPASVPLDEIARWLELLSYIHALVYHERNLSEHERLHRTIEESVANVENREETLEMGKTIAEALREEGRIEGREEAELGALRATLTRQLRRKFKNVPDTAVQAIEATDDVERLASWLDRLITARNLADLKIT